MLSTTLSGLLVAVALLAVSATRLEPPAPARAASSRSALDVSATIRDSLTVYYTRQNPAGVESLLRRARTREDRLLCLYRLYPMTRDRGYLREIPPDAGVTSARELALIAAMWAYRASSGPAYRLPDDGRRSERILTAALPRDADDPYALLVRGQSLYYKPRMFGGDFAEAQRTFEQLRTVLAQRTVPGMHPFEAEVWVWMAVRRQDAAQGAALRDRLLARRPPPLFRQFLVDPP